MPASSCSHFSITSLLLSHVSLPKSEREQGRRERQRGEKEVEVDSHIVAIMLSLLRCHHHCLVIIGGRGEERGERLAIIVVTLVCKVDGENKFSINGRTCNQFFHLWKTRSSPQLL